jgi:hypothetical protein
MPKMLALRKTRQLPSWLISGTDNNLTLPELRALRGLPKSITRSTRLLWSSEAHQLSWLSKVPRIGKCFLVIAQAFGNENLRIDCEFMACLAPAAIVSWQHFHDSRSGEGSTHLVRMSRILFWLSEASKGRNHGTNTRPFWPKITHVSKYPCCQVQQRSTAW